jgi:hypothetical protein
MNPHKETRLLKRSRVSGVLDRNKTEFQAMASVGLEPTRFRG